MPNLRSCSLRRYHVAGDLPSPRSATFAKRLADRRFRPLTAREERAYGWVDAGNLLVTDFEAERLRCGAYQVFGLRIDRRRVNARLLRAHVALETQARLQTAVDAGRPRRLSRDERHELRAGLHAELLARTSPSVNSYRVLLDPKRRLLLFSSLARPANEVLRVLFRDTFGADLQPLTPWRRAADLLGSSGRTADLDGLVRSAFTAPEAGATGVRWSATPGVPS
ncbi:MAG: recombination-associated protein RdgC [Planctomycetota bacterium]|jgi:DNA recombination-dependent growth factor C